MKQDKKISNPLHKNNCTRRQFLRLAALAGGVALIGGCGGASSSGESGSTYDPIKAKSQEDGSLLIPGGGKLKENKAFAFVTQEKAPGILYMSPDGTLKAISALCTHQGCEVHWEGIDKPLICPCHGSKFRLDGSVINGPASEPLPTYEARKQGDDAVVIVV